MKNTRCALRAGMIAFAAVVAIGIFSFTAAETGFAYTQRAVMAEDTQEPTAPADPEVPTDPTTPTDPTMPTDPTTPTDPTDPTTPTEPQPPVKNGWEGDTYYKDGVKVTGYEVIEGKVYYFDSNGLKQTKTYQTYNQLMYYFGTDGTGTVFSGTYKGKIYKSGRLFSGNKSGYYYKNGVRHTGKAGKYYYKNGLKLTGTANGCYYKNGIKYSGVKGDYYYISGQKQAKYRSKVAKMSNGKIYYFTKTGRISNTNGWKRYGGKRYYFKSTAAQTGWHYIGGYKYYFAPDGVLVQDLIARFGNSWMKKDLLIKVNRAKNCVTIYAKDGSKGYSIPVKAMTCSVGKANTPTVKGTYDISGGKTYRWHKLGGPSMGGYSYGQFCSRITGSYLFHSVTYRTPNKRALITKEYNKLGNAASHGCVRLQVANAKIIYDIANYRKTKVIIYDGSKISPFDKPAVKQIPLGQNYDPTDPTI